MVQNILPMEQNFLNHTPLCLNFLTLFWSFLLASVSTLEKVFCAMQNKCFETLRDLSQLSKENLSKWNVLSPDEVYALVSGKVISRNYPADTFIPNREQKKFIL